MSYVLQYQDPYKLPAGLLALAVHVAFISLLVFGLRWQAQPNESFSVELWDQLSVAEPVIEPAPAPPVEAAPTAAVKEQVQAPSQTQKAEIQLREKKVNKNEPTKSEPAKPSTKELKAKREAEEQRVLEEYAEQRRQSIQAKVRAEIAASTAAEVGRYQDMIRSKIRRNIVGIPPELPESAKAEFKVTMLPGGMVMEVQLIKSSGNTAYDDAAERAIYKAQPLPMPADVALQKMFRELRLSIRPQE